MEWKDTAIVIHVHSYNDELLIISCLSSKYGLCSGSMRNTKANRGVACIGNVISVTWRGRLETHLGKFAVNGHESIYPFIYHDERKMLAMVSLCELFYKNLSPKEPQKSLYRYLEDFLYSIKYDEENWLKRLVFIELELLSHVGFGLDLTKCAISGSVDNLIYLSPKTGRAISKEIGALYEGKLFKLPRLFYDFDGGFLTEELIYALRVTKHFLTKHLVISESRNKLEEILQKRISSLE